jgi:hypothetical protein
MRSICRSAVTRIFGQRCSTRSRWARSLSALSLLALLGGMLGACDDDIGEGSSGRRGRFGRDDDRWDREGRGREGWRRWHRGHRHDDTDASADADGDAGNAATDAGDAGPATNAETADAAAQPAGEDLLDAGAGADAAPASAAAALSDAQILLVADNLLAGAISQAQAALPRLANADALGFAEQLIDEDAATRNTLALTGDAIGASPAGSDIADAISAQSDALGAAFAEPDAGALDALYIDSTLTAHAAALSLVSELAAAADAPALRAQLVVLQTVLGVQLERAQEVGATL